MLKNFLFFIDKSFIYKKLIKPKNKNEDISRVEFILNIILLASIFLISFAFLQTVVDFFSKGELYKDDNPIFLFIILISFIGLLVLSRKGFIKTASYLVITFYFLPISHGAYYFGIDQPQTILSYTLIIVAAGILLGSRISFIVTIIISSFLLVLKNFQLAGFYLPHSFWKKEEVTTTDIIIFSITFFVLSIISWLSNRETEKSLIRARKAEKELRAERDSLEIKVKERTKELEESQFEKTKQMHQFVEFGRIASGIFHDLVNPIQAANLAIEAIKESSEINTNKEIFSLTDAAIRQMNKAKEFINIARNQITKQEINIKFDPEEQIALVFQMLMFKAKRAHVDLMYTQHDTQLNIVGNPLSFNRLISGLVSNAIDSYDGFVSDNKRKVTLISEEKKESLIFSIKDNGKGVSEENQKKIFELFFTTKGLEKGTGIGLALCKEIAEKEFKGRLSFESKEGVGTTFTIVIPINNL